MVQLLKTVVEADVRCACARMQVGQRTSWETMAFRERKHMPRRDALRQDAPCRSYAVALVLFMVQNDGREAVHVQGTSINAGKADADATAARVDRMVAWR